MELVGKCPPEPAELEAAANRGFDKIELYLEKTHLDNFDETVTILQNAPVSVRSVHTPHVPVEEKQYITLADELALEFGASLVVHSSKIPWSHIPDIEALNLRSSYGYENSTGYSQEYIERRLFSQGHRVTFDVAHFALGYNHSEQKIEDFLTMYGKEIEVIHLCDATELVDGVPFTDGLLDAERIVHAIENNYDGPVVLEVMPDEQQELRTSVTDILDGMM